MKVKMECPECQAHIYVDFDPATMPAGTVYVLTYCPDCDEGEKCTEMYFDADSNQVFPDETTKGGAR